MSHTIREKTKLLDRARRIRGQIEAVERATESEIGGADVMRLVAGACDVINGLMAEVVEDRVRRPGVDPGCKLDSERAQATEELIEAMRSDLNQAGWRTFPWAPAPLISVAGFA